MATLIPFKPNGNAAPPFQATVILDGASYSLVAMWNLYRGDWYVSLTDQNGTLLVWQPLIGSPPGTSIPLGPGFFKASTLSYDVASGNFIQTP